MQDVFPFQRILFDSDVLVLPCADLHGVIGHGAVNGDWNELVVCFRNLGIGLLNLSLQSGCVR